MRGRKCRRPGCGRNAVATLTSNYADSTIVIGPLSVEADPQAYDLCEVHVDSFTAPRQWQVVRLVTEFEPAPPTPDDLDALAEAVRAASRRSPKRSEAVDRARSSMPADLRNPRSATEVTRRSHLRLLKGEKAG